MSSAPAWWRPASSDKETDIAEEWAIHDFDNFSGVSATRK